MTALKKIAGPRTFLLVGDSKLISYANAAVMAAAQVAFVAPLAAARVPAGAVGRLAGRAGTEVDYVGRRDAASPPPRGAPTGCLRTTGWTCAAPQERSGGALAPDLGVLPAHAADQAPGPGSTSARSIMAADGVAAAVAACYALAWRLRAPSPDAPEAGLRHPRWLADAAAGAAAPARPCPPAARSAWERRGFTWLWR